MHYDRNCWVANKTLEMMGDAPTTPLLDRTLMTAVPTAAAHFAKLDSITEVKSKILADGVIARRQVGVPVHSTHSRTLFQYKGNKKPLVTH